MRAYCRYNSSTVDGGRHQVLSGEIVRGKGGLGEEKIGAFRMEIKRMTTDLEKNIAGSSGPDWQRRGFAWLEHSTRDSLEFMLLF